MRGSVPRPRDHNLSQSQESDARATEPPRRASILPLVAVFLLVWEGHCASRAETRVLTRTVSLSRRQDDFLPLQESLPCAAPGLAGVTVELPPTC